LQGKESRSDASDVSNQWQNGPGHDPWANRGSAEKTFPLGSNSGLYIVSKEFFSRENEFRRLKTDRKTIESSGPRGGGR
jgi:hypothetical protein